MTTTILTIFAGREVYMRILMKYVQCLMDRGLVQECHVWDYSRDLRDYKYLLSECSAEARGVRLMSVTHKDSWSEYYNHYATTYGARDDVVVVKCDDDVVYIDVDAFPGFLAFRTAHPEHLFVFGTIVNNGLVAHLQQNTYPTGGRYRLASAGSEACPHEFELSVGGFERLVNDGCKAAWLHEWFLSREGARRAEGTTTPDAAAGAGAHIVLPMEQRISINFFAVMSRDLHLFAPPGGIQDDERYLTQVLPSRVQRHNCVFTDFAVSHFAFGPQRLTGLDGEVERGLLSRYDALAPATGHV